MTIASSYSNSDVVTHDLATQHCKRFALSGVDLSGHNGRSRFIGWKI
jgi:hypothetical protein